MPLLAAEPGPEVHRPAVVGVLLLRQHAEPHLRVLVADLRLQPVRAEHGADAGARGVLDEAHDLAAVFGVLGHLLRSRVALGQSRVRVDGPLNFVVAGVERQVVRVHLMWPHRR